MPLPTFVVSQRTFVGSATASDFAVPCPPAVVALLPDTPVVMACLVRRTLIAGLPGTPTMPGWTQLGDFTSQFVERDTFFARTTATDGTEPASYIVHTGVTGGVFECLLVAYAHAHDFGGGSGFVNAQDQTTTTITSPAFTPTVANTAVVSWVLSRNGAITPVGTQTRRLAPISTTVAGQSAVYEKDTSTLTSQTTSFTVPNADPANFIGVAMLAPLSRAPYASPVISPLAQDVDNVEVEWHFSDPDGSIDQQTQVRFRRRVNTIGSSYEWWKDTTNTWVSSEYSNTDFFDSFSIPFPTGAWTVGNWLVSVASADTDGNWGPYGSESSLLTSHVPSFAFSAPADSEVVVDTNEPTFEWAYSQTESYPQASYQIRVFTAAQAAAAGFNAKTSAAVLDSGRVQRAADRAWTPSAVLPNNTSYVAYGWAQSSAGLTSVVDSVAFSIVVDPPAVPTVTAVSTLDASGPYMKVTVQGHDNLLSALTAEADTSGWRGRLNATNLQPDTTDFVHGPSSLTFDSIDVGVQEVETVNTIAVNGNTRYSLIGAAKYVDAPSDVELVAEWNDDQGVVIGQDPIQPATEQPLNPLPPAPPDLPTYTLRYSTTADRLNASPLVGATVSGSIYVFLDPPDLVASAASYVDTTLPPSGTAVNVDTIPPFDLFTSAPNNAAPWDTTKLTDGSHNVVMVVTTTDSRQATVSASFTVSNPVLPPLPAYTVNYSTSPTRVPSQPLESVAVSGSIYPFLAPASLVQSVTFHDPLFTDFPDRTETSPPFDVKGGTTSAANPLDTTALADGFHGIAFTVTATDGRTATGRTNYGVSNTPVTPPDPQGNTTPKLAKKPPGYPNYTGFTRITITNADVGYNSATGSMRTKTLSGNASGNYLLTIGEPLNGALIIDGGGKTSNIVLIGGEINIGWQGSSPITPSGLNVNKRRGLLWFNCTGNVYWEGVYIHGSDLSEGIQVSKCGDCVGQRFVTLGMHARSYADEEGLSPWTNTNHSDGIQPYGGCSSLFVDYYDCSTSMQGHLFGIRQSTAPTAAQKGPVTIQHATYRDFPVVSEVDPTKTLHARQLLGAWQTDGAGGTGTWEQADPFTFDHVYVALGPQGSNSVSTGKSDFNLSTFTATMGSRLGFSGGATTMHVGKDSQGRTTASFTLNSGQPASRAITGTIFEYRPDLGDAPYVDPAGSPDNLGVPGMLYISPGYL